MKQQQQLQLEAMTAHTHHTSASSQASRERLRALADLKKTAPEFAGKPEEFYFFKQSLEGFIGRHQLQEDEPLAVDVAINACKEGARRYISSLPFPPDTMVEFWAALERRYGEALSTRVAKWRALKQKEGESVREFADHLQEASYGL